MVSYFMDTIIGSIPWWAWWAGSGALAAVVFGLLRVYLGDWRLAAGVAVAIFIIIFTFGKSGRDRLAGRMAERAAAQKAATKRAAKRKERNDEIDSLGHADVDKRLSRWVRKDHP